MESQSSTQVIKMEGVDLNSVPLTPPKETVITSSAPELPVNRSLGNNREPPALGKSKVETENKVNKQNELHQLKVYYNTMVNDPDFSRLDLFKEYDISDATVEEMKELNQKIEDTLLATCSFNIVGEAVHGTFAYLEGRSMHDKNFPIRLAHPRGTTISQQLQLHDPKSDYNVLLKTQSRKITKGLILQPWQGLLATTLVAISKTHTINRAVESIEEKMEERGKVDQEELEEEVNENTIELLKELPE